MPNRRRRRLSTAMSAVAALAVASPAAVVAVSDLSDSTKPPTQHRQFVQAAMITDLPSELMSALSQGLSQFGINLPPMPTSLLTGSGSSVPTTTLTTPGLGTAPVDHTGVGNVSADHAQPGYRTADDGARHVARRDVDQSGADARAHQPGRCASHRCDAASRPDHAACGHRSGARVADLQRGGPARPGRGPDLGAHRAWIPLRAPTRSSVIHRWRRPLPPPAAAGCSAT